MPTNTTNFNLIKPIQGEFYTVDIPNNNMDTIDGVLKTLQDAISSGASEQDLGVLRQALTTHLAEKASKTVYGHVKVGNGLSVANGVISADIPTIQDASTTVKGISMLSNNIDGTSEAKAATEKAVKDAKDSRLPLTGGTITGDLTIQKGVPGVNFDASRAKRSQIIWNASLNSDFGMNFVIDGESIMQLYSDGIGRLNGGDLLQSKNLANFGVLRGLKGTFVGTGSSGRVIDIGIVAKFAIVWRGSGSLGFYFPEGGTYSNNGLLSNLSGISGTSIRLLDTHDTIGQTHHYLAFY